MDAAIFRLTVVARNVDQSNHSMLVLLRYLYSTVLKGIGLIHGNPIAGVPLPRAAHHRETIKLGLHKLHP